MRIFPKLVGSSLLALMAGTAAAQVTTVGTNRSEVQDNGTNNKALVENGAEGNDRNSSLIVFTGSDNRVAIVQTGDDNGAGVNFQGSANSSTVRQLGFRNSAATSARGDRNQSSIDQYRDPRVGLFGDRVANVEQVGSDNSSSVVQVHWNNNAAVRQGTSSDAQSNGAVSTIFQYSAGNVATVTMVGGSPDAANRSHVEQTRIDPVLTNSRATVDINGSFNLSYLYQVGANNVATHTVTGTQNTITGRSYGNSLSSSVLQQGYRNIATLNQFAGDRNSSRIEQLDNSTIGPGGDRQVFVTQGGSDNSSTVSQRFSQNAVVVNQSGLGTVSSVTQNGVGNFARANLLDGSVDAPNKSTIDQQWNLGLLGTRFVAEVSVRGLGNESSVSQRGVRHVVSVEMAGGGAGNGEAGRRRGNSVAIAQDETVAPGSDRLVNEAGHSARVQVGLVQGGGIGTSTAIRQLGQHGTIGNDATVRQNGQYDTVFVDQSIGFVEGEGGAVANVSARGFLNSVSISQFGRQFAFVTQGFGRESTFAATSYGNGGRRNGQFVGPGVGNNSINASQNGDRNRVGIGQEGSFNGATVWQKVGSSDNSIGITQGLQTFGPVDEVFGCSFRCEMATNSVASAIQSSRYNDAQITQYSTASKATIEQNGTGTSDLPNSARITQFLTSSAEATILQTADVGPSGSGDPSSGAVGDPGYFAGGARASEARIRQSSGAGSARIEQRGKGQYAFIDQSGANTASILQDIGATNATAIITQSGSGNVYNVVQDRPGQYISVSQTGTNNGITNVVTRP